MTQLYVVPTPLGNLKDITLRALEVLNSVNYIFCEDTRRAQILLKFYKIENKKLISYFAPHEEKKIPLLLNILKKEKAALIVDAGMPLISDPGYKLVKACLDHNLKVEVLPGPSAFLVALVGSGILAERFVFLGFLPKKGLINFLMKFKNLKLTLIFYESPHRILKTLKIVYETLGNGQVAIAREISKIHEEYIRGDLINIIEKLQRQKLKGELTVILRCF